MPEPGTRSDRLQSGREVSATAYPQIRKDLKDALDGLEQGLGPSKRLPSSARSAEEVFPLFFVCLISFVSARCEWSVRLSEVQIMPILTFDKVLKIISTILNILSAALSAFSSSYGPSNIPVDVDEEGHS